MLTINSRREVYINKSFFCRTHSKATMSQWCDSSDVVLPTLLWRRRNITEVNDSPTFPLGGANLERCDVMWKLQWISCFICYWLSVKNVSLNGCTKTPDLNMLLQCNANNFLHTLRHTHNTVTSGHRCPSWIVPDNLYFICRGVTGSISPEVSLVKLSHLKGLTRRMNLLMFAKPHTSSSSSVSILVIFFVPWPLSQDISCDITKKAQQWYYLICFSVRSKIWHFAPVLHQPSLFMQSLWVRDAVVCLVN